MMFRNAFRLFGANFSLVWKNLSYKLIVILAFSGIMVAFSVTIIKQLISADIFKQMGALLGDMSSLSLLEFSKQVVQIVQEIVDVVALTFGDLVVNYIGIIVSLFLMFLFINMAELPMTEVIKGHMSSLSKFGFCGAYLRNFWRAFKQSLVLIIIKIPFWAIIGVSGYYILNLMTISSLWSVLSPMLFVMIVALLISIKNTIFACFTPYLCLHDCGAYHALSKGVDIVSHRFYRTWSNNIVYILLAFIINFVCARYTFGVSLLLTLPATIVFHNIFNMVVYYESQGMRYYIDSMTIMRTKDFCEQDSPKQAKNVI